MQYLELASAAYSLLKALTAILLITMLSCCTYTKVNRNDMPGITKEEHVITLFGYGEPEKKTQAVRK